MNSTLSNVLSIIFSGVVTVATVVYVILTRQLARETREMRRVASEPLVSIYVELSERSWNIVNLVIENIGAGPAYDLTFTMNHDWVILPNAPTTLKQMSLIKNGVRYLAPRQKLKTLIGSGVEIAKRPTRSFDLAVHYRSARGEQSSETFTISFDHLIGIISSGTRAEERVAKAVEKIADEVQRWSGGTQKLHIELRTQEDIQKRDEELRTYYDELARQNSAPADAKILPPATPAEIPAGEPSRDKIREPAPGESA